MPKFRIVLLFVIPKLSLNAVFLKTLPKDFGLVESLTNCTAIFLATGSFSFIDAVSLGMSASRKAYDKINFFKACINLYVTNELISNKLVFALLLVVRIISCFVLNIVWLFSFGNNFLCIRQPLTNVPLCFIICAPLITGIFSFA